MTTHDKEFVECPFCGSDRAGILGVEQEDIPPAIIVVIECFECDHHYGFDVATASEQVHVGLYPFACPEGCPDVDGKHTKLLQP